MTEDRDIKKEIYSSLAIFIMSLFYYLGYAQYGVIEGDWGMIAVGAEKFLKGEVFYRDFSILYTPGIYIYTAMFFKLFGVSLSSAMVGWSILRALNCLIIYLIGTEFVSRRIACILPLLLWFVPGVLHKSFFVFFLLLDIFILIKMVSSKSRIFYFICGIASIVTLVFRVDLFGFFLIAAVIVEFLKSISLEGKIIDSSKIMMSPTNFFYLSYGVIAGFIPLMLYLFSNSALNEAYRQTFGYSAAMKSLYFDLPPVSQIFSLNLIAIQKYIGAFLPFVLYLFVFISIVLIIIKREGWHFNAKDKKLLIVLLFGCMSLNQVVMYPGVGRIGMILSPVLIIDVYLIARYFNNKSSYLKKLRMMHLASLGGLNFILVPFILFSCIIPDVFINGSFFIRFTNPVYMSDSRLHVYTTNKYADNFHKITDVIKDLTKENEYIFTFPGSYQLYLFVTGRQPLEKFAFIGEYLKSEERQREVIRLIEEKNVRVIIAELTLEMQKRKTWAPVLNEYIMEHYEIRQTIGSFSLLVRNE
ncbi:MAG: hypothetical protein HZB61_06575 [Nitrospirae bacterium]|nr:hypothetical protein [Nitrospirota bacterium]